ncbi:MAG: glycosyltransferase [Candidatus Baltobacteraceae bacterium]
MQLRVGFFTECYRPIVNGVVASVDALAEGLRGRGHDVYCFTPSVPGYIEGDAAILRMPSLPLPMKTAYRLTLPLVSRRNLNSVVKRLSIIHAHSPFITGWMGVRYARRFGIPLVYTYHTQLEQYAHYLPFDAGTTRRAATTLTRSYANMADAVVVPTESMRRRLQDVGVTSRIEVMPSGIDLEFFSSGVRREHIRRASGAFPGSRMLLFISRLAREKNADLLLRAIALTPDPSLHLVLGGEGPERESLEAMARDLGIAGRVSFLGPVGRLALPDLYATADAFVFPSASETQGLVLAEALAAGVPVIAVDTPQTRDVLGGQARYVTTDPGSFAAAFADVAGFPDPAARASARLSAARFGITLQTDHMLELYEDLLARSLALA